MYNNHYELIIGPLAFVAHAYSRHLHSIRLSAGTLAR